MGDLGFSPATQQVQATGHGLLPEALPLADVAVLRRALLGAAYGPLVQIAAVEGTPVARVIDLRAHAEALGIAALVARVVATPALQHAARRVFGGAAPVLRNVYSVHSLPTPAPMEALPYGWHFDRLGMVKGFLLLDEVTERDGPTEVAPEGRAACRSLRLTALRIGRDPLSVDNRLADPSGPAISLTGKAGQMILLDTDTPHRAGHVLEGPGRLVLRVDLWARPPADEPKEESR